MIKQLSLISMYDVYARESIKLILPINNKKNIVISVVHISYYFLKQNIKLQTIMENIKLF